MSTQLIPAEQRIERLITMAGRLIEALENDIASLKAGNARGLRTIDPEIQKLTLLYSREASGLDAESAKEAPLELLKRLSDATGRFRDLLGHQTRLLTRLRSASEGIVRAVAEEVERQRAPMRTYGPSSTQMPSARSPMLHNSVV